MLVMVVLNAIWNVATSNVLSVAPQGLIATPALALDYLEERAGGVAHLVNAFIGDSHAFGGFKSYVNDLSILKLGTRMLREIWAGVKVN